MKLSTAETEVLETITIERFSEVLEEWGWKKFKEAEIKDQPRGIWRKEIGAQGWQLNLPLASDPNPLDGIKNALRVFCESEDIAPFVAIAILDHGRLPLHGGLYMEYDETQNSCTLKV